MTPKERMLAAIRGGTPDRVPFSTYNCHPFSWSPHVADPGYAPILDAIGRTQAGCLCKTSAVRGKTAVEPIVEKHREGSSLVEVSTFETPRGALTTITQTPDGQPARCIKSLVTSDADIERYLSIPYVEPAWNVAAVLSNAAEIADKGMAYLDYADPFNQVAELFDAEEFMLRSITDFPSVKYLVERQFERELADLKRLLAALAPSPEPLLFYTAGPERATPPLMPPAIFETLIVPFHRTLVRVIHDHGYPVSLHCHGRVRAVLPLIIECGFDVLEPIEPPPQGDIDLQELRDATGGRLCLMGYVQDQELYTSTEKEIRERIRSIGRIVNDGKGYICAPTCTPFQHPPTPTYVENYQAFLDEADRIF